MKIDTKNGLTLLEVLVAMGLLGTLLVSLLAAHGRYAITIERSAERLKIQHETEKLLASWFLKLGMIPVEARGELLVGENTYRWRTTPKERLIDPDFLIGKVTLDVLDLEERETYLTLELVVPAWSE